MKVLLVHGMGRTPVSMWRLSRALGRAGHRTRLFAYATAWQSVDTIVRRMDAALAIMADDEYVVIGHSLGGLLLRIAIARLPEGVGKPRRVIMLGTPNLSPRLARRFRKSWWYRLLNGSAGELLADESRMGALPGCVIPCTMIAGIRGINGSWSPFGEEPNDGLVAASETWIDGDVERITVPARHPFIMNNRDVRALILARCAG